MAPRDSDQAALWRATCHQAAAISAASSHGEQQRRLHTWVRVILVHQGAVSALGVGMLGDSPAGSANGRLAAAPLLAPKGLAAGLLVDGPNGLTGVLSARQGNTGLRWY